MTDKEHEELATALLLVLGDRNPKDIARAIITAMGNRYWYLEDALREAQHVVTLDSLSARYLRERLEEGYLNEEDGETPERFKESVSDEDIYAACTNANVLYDASGYMVEDVIRGFREQGLIENIPTEVTQDVPHQTS